MDRIENLVRDKIKISPFGRNDTNSVCVDISQTCKQILAISLFSGNAATMLLESGGDVDDRPGFGECACPLIAAGDLGESSSPARDIPPAWTGLHSHPSRFAPFALWCFPRSDSAPSSAVIFTELDRVAPCSGDFGGLHLCGSGVGAPRLPCHGAGRADLSR